MKRGHPSSTAVGDELISPPPLAKRRKSNTKFLSNKKACDVTFLVPRIETSDSLILSDEKEMGLDSSNKNNGSLDDSDDVSYVEYPCVKAFLCFHSSYFENILYNNQETTVKTKIKLNDIDANTFEFVRDYCYPGSNDSNILTKYNVLNILCASHKYDIKSLFDDCLAFIQTKWLVNGDSLIEFIDYISKDESRCNLYNTIILHNLKKILFSKPVLEIFSIYFGNHLFIRKMACCISLNVLSHVLECLENVDSSIMDEEIKNHLMWGLIDDEILFTCI